MSSPIRLGVNIDHAATLRNARGGIHPSPLVAAHAAQRGGADQITAHLREDRRHINEDDMTQLRRECDLPLNMELAPADDVFALALSLQPYACCFVPERREEITTESGLAVARVSNRLAPMVKKLQEKGIRVSFFIDPNEGAVKASSSLGADAVELHTGPYCHAVAAGDANQQAHEFARLEEAAKLAFRQGLEVHAGHGLDYQTAVHLARIEVLHEVNIGHFLIGEALTCGLEESVWLMKEVLTKARSEGITEKCP